MEDVAEPRIKDALLSTIQMALPTDLAGQAKFVTLKTSKCLSPMQEFQAHKKQSTGLLGRVSDSIQNFGASYMMKNRTPEFTIMYEYIQTFGEKLGSIDRITQRVVKEQSG